MCNMLVCSITGDLQPDEPQLWRRRVRDLIFLSTCGLVRPPSPQQQGITEGAPSTSNNVGELAGNAAGH